MLVNTYASVFICYLNVCLNVFTSSASHRIYRSPDIRLLATPTTDISTALPYQTFWLIGNLLRVTEILKWPESLIVIHAVCGFISHGLVLNAHTLPRLYKNRKSRRQGNLRILQLQTVCCSWWTELWWKYYYCLLWKRSYKNDYEINSNWSCEKKLNLKYHLFVN